MSDEKKGINYRLVSQYFPDAGGQIIIIESDDIVAALEDVRAENLDKRVSLNEASSKPDEKKYVIEIYK
jgi:hypothetical protein